MAEEYTPRFRKRLYRLLTASTYPLNKSNSEELWDLTNYLHEGGLEKIPREDKESIKNYFLAKGDSYRRGFFMDMQNPLKIILNWKIYYTAKKINNL